jgi:hypothetical protein
MVWVGFRRDDETARETLETRRPGTTSSKGDDDDDEKSVDLDKAWHGLDWLLTGSADATFDVASSRSSAPGWTPPPWTARNSPRRSGRADIFEPSSPRRMSSSGPSARLPPSPTSLSSSSSGDGRHPGS